MLIVLCSIGFCCMLSGCGDGDESPTITTPLTIFIADAWWSGLVDDSGDHFNRLGTLNFNVDVSGDGTAQVYVKIYYKISTSSSFTEYFTTDDFIITGSSANDEHAVPVGGPNTELDHNRYDFEIHVYRSGSSAVEDAYGPSDDSHLRDQKFEKASQDVIIRSIYIQDAWWSDVIDVDLDGYSRYGRLNLDVDAIGGATERVYAEIYYKVAATPWYLHYFTTDRFSITGISTEDASSVAMGSPNFSFLHNTYDFKIEVYRSESGTVQDAHGPLDDSHLNNQKFEKPYEDLPDIYFRSAWWSDSMDNDGDGYTQYRRLVFDVDVTSGATEQVNVKVLRKLARSSSYTLYFTTSEFTITGRTASDTNWLSVGSPNSELDHDTYDFKIQVCRSGSQRLEDSVGPLEDSHRMRPDSCGKRLTPPDFLNLGLKPPPDNVLRR
jgi:hypothetical protein